MEPDMLRVLLQEACLKAGGATRYAASVGVSREFVRLVLGGKREPGDRLLAALGLERVVTYRARTEGDHDLPQGMLQMASAFEVLPYSQHRKMRSVQVVRRAAAGYPEAWAIVGDAGLTLSRSGEWEYESMPSSRTEAYFRRCRWPTAAEAIAFARVHIQENPEDYASLKGVQVCHAGEPAK